MKTMGRKDTWTVLNYLLGFPIAILLAHLSIKNGPLHQSIDVHKCLLLLNGSSDNCYKEFDTQDGMLRNGQKGEKINRHCEKCSEGSQYKAWKPIQDDCVLQVMKDLERKAEALVLQDIPEFVSQLSNATVTNAQAVTESPLTVQTIVEILVRIANISKNIIINKPEMEDVLKTVDILVSDKSIKTWKKLKNGNATATTSTKMLGAIENISSSLTDDSFTITKTFIELNRTIINASYSGKSKLPNSSTEILIHQVLEPTSLTIIIFTTLNNILPTRESNNGRDLHINGDVVVVKGKKMFNNISLTFDINDQSLGNPQCVFWNFSLDAWDSTGCEVKTISTWNKTGKITCECNHTTSFSNLMSPFFIDEKALDYITYIGLAISLVSLILCLVIEAIVWKLMTANDTSYMRHVSIVNMAFSLLIADICFFIGVTVVQPGEPAPVGPCSAVAFFMHFSYLALFFWTLNSALLLLYRTLMVLSYMSKAKMMGIAFTVGYGVPLLIAVITVASTSQAGTYILDADVCWLNINETKTLQVFVILALTIVAINLAVLVIVLYKMLRRGVGAATQPDEKHTLVVIARCVAILTPIFGLTWGFGIGTMVSADLGIHVVFALLNSLQGFFILVFGTLLDSKVREALAGRLSRRNLIRVSTINVAKGPSDVIARYFARRNAYKVSSAFSSGSNASYANY